MNTVKSVYYGWVTFILAGGGAYFFAKRSISADRAQKAEADYQKRVAQYNLEQSYLLDPSFKSQNTSKPTSSATAAGDAQAGNPSVEATADPAPTRHAPVDAEGRVMEKSKYEATETYRMRKGDRFS